MVSFVVFLEKPLKNLYFFFSLILFFFFFFWVWVSFYFRQMFCKSQGDKNYLPFFLLDFSFCSAILSLQVSALILDGLFGPS